ncbi:bicaudal D-related protein homolog [Ixodes scapularis]
MWLTTFVQALEQEKHALRRKLDSVSGESDGRLSELQADLAQARQQLAEQQALLRSLDRERGAVVHEMADQNQRLAQELKAARRAEDQAASQYRSLREQLSLRRSSLDDHVSQLEGLREEITLLSDRKAELERRISALVDERESLSLSLEESGDRILLLEKQRHDYEAQIRNQQRDMEELRVANVQLQERLDAAQRLRSSSPLPGHSLGHRSLFNEIEMSSSSSADDDAASTIELMWLTTFVQALEQEKHALRRKLDSVSGESDGRLSELQADLAQARQQLAEQQALLRSLDRERGAVVHEMADQNQRLAQELKAARRAEDQAASQYRSLREQLSLRRSSLDDHVSQLEGLREEITLLSDRKAELERRISALVDERESLSLSLEESGDRILLLEKQRHDYEAQIRNQQRDMEELRVANVQLQERLDAAQRLRSSSPLPGHSLGHRSLFNEIEMSSSSSADDDAASTGRRSRQLSQLGSSSAGFAADLDEIECDECELGSEEDKLRQELAQALQELQRLVSDLRRHRDSAASSDSGVPPSPAEVHPRDVTGHMLSAILADLRLLLQDMLAGSETREKEVTSTTLFGCGLVESLMTRCVVLL